MQFETSMAKWPHDIVSTEAWVAARRIRLSARAVAIRIEENALRSAIEIIILAAAQGPQKGRESRTSQQQGQGNKVDETTHSAGSNATPCEPARFDEALAGCCASLPGFRRSALATTRIEENDMASAAIKGVTKPAMAMGNAMAL